MLLAFLAVGFVVVWLLLINLVAHRFACYNHMPHRRSISENSQRFVVYLIVAVVAALVVVGSGSDGGSGGGTGASSICDYIIGW